MKDFKKYYLLPATPQEIYTAITNPVTIELWTGESAEMSTIPGSEFSMWDGSITGKNIDFEEGKKIVQQWYFEGQDEPSIVTIKLHEDKHGTSAELRHTNIPDEAYTDITEGWTSSYFGGLEIFSASELMLNLCTQVIFKHTTIFSKIILNLRACLCISLL